MKQKEIIKRVKEIVNDIHKEFRNLSIENLNSVSDLIKTYREEINRLESDFKLLKPKKNTIQKILFDRTPSLLEEILLSREFVNNVENSLLGCIENINKINFHQDESLIGSPSYKLNLLRIEGEILSTIRQCGDFHLNLTLALVDDLMSDLNDDPFKLKPEDSTDWENKTQSTLRNGYGDNIGF